MARRNFNMLFEEEEDNARSVPTNVEKIISRKIESARLTGDVVELFLPKVFNTILQFFGGSQSEDSPDYQSDTDDPASSTKGYGPPL